MTESSLPMLITWDRLVLYAAVALTGAAVMVLEILGTRILAPFYGTSLIVWTALITVTLVALAVGYFLGGWLAGRTILSLADILAIAGVTCALIPLLANPVLVMTDPLGLHLGALVSATLLFALPLSLLAMVGPWIIHLSCRHHEQAGVTSGTVYAISTLGSVAGTLGLSFYLLPVFGSHFLLGSLGIVLLGLSAVLFGWQAKRLRQPWRPIWLIVAAVFVIGALYLSKATYSKALFQRESLYGKIAVVDDKKRNARWLLADASIIGGIDLTTGQSRLAYQDLVIEALSIHPLAQDALLIGLGAGTLVPKLSQRGLAVDVIEIDPAVAEAAARYFGFRPPGKLWLADARTQVRQIPHLYDLIIHDCFTGGSEPVHLLTQEAFQDLRAKLRPEGVLLLNFVGFRQGPGRQALDAVWRTLRSVFSQVEALATDPEADFNDFLLLASEQPIKLSDNLVSYRLNSAPSAGPIVSDDHNPLDLLQRQKAKTYRAVLFAQVGELFL
ncbi:MAG: fused MFS/spermidine synthase [Methylohalobius sp.]|nr:fused MFS/spermidine synthase [Methylohalobius sp.]